MPELGGEQSEYCLHVNDNGTFATTDDNLLIATETGLYNFGTNQLSNIPLAVPGPYNTKYYEPTSILQRSPNSLEYFITIYGMGLFSYNTNTKVWTNMITNLNAQNKNNGVYDDFVNNREYQNFTRLIRLPNNNGWVLMNEDNLVKYNNNNYYVGAFYSADNSGQPNGNWTALNVFDGITDDWGWNTSTPCSNVNSTILTPNNHLLAGKSGNIFVTRNALTNGTPLNTSWQGIYSCLQQNNGCETYRHKGYVNTAPKCIFNDDNNRVWLGMHDRLLWESDDNGSYFNELTAGCTYSLPNQPNANSACNVPATNLTDCFFITKDPSTGANYAGVGAGYASKKGLGCVLQLIGNAWTQVGNSLCGDPVKMIFSDMHIYVLVNTIDGQTKLYGLNGATWDEVNFGSTLKIYDVLISPLGDVIYIIKSDNDGVHGYAITNSNFLDFSTSLGTPFIIPNIKLQAMKLIPCSSCANEYKIIAGAYPKNYTATYSNLYSIFADLSSGIALDGAGGTADIFKKLYIDNLDHTDDGINYIEINESLNRIYVSTVSFDYGNTSTPPTGKIYAADFDPIDASIAPTSWQDITANLPNKAIKYINSNGATCGNEFIYAVVRGLGAWRLGVDVNASGNISSTPFCINGTSTLTANLPPLYTANNYLWNTSETTAAITISAAGTYTVTVTGTGCGGTAISTYTQSIKVLAMDFNIKSFNTCTGSTGAATVIDNGMNHPLTYLWNGGSTLKSIANLGNTTYTVTITDNVGCSVTKTVSITNTTITIGTPTSTAAACSGTVGGTLNFTASGGTLPYTYTLSNGAFNLNGQFKNLAQGTFTVTVTDFNGCTANSHRECKVQQVYTIGDPVGIYNLNSITVANNLTLSGYTLYATTSTTNITVPTAKTLTLNTGTAIHGCTTWQGIINNGTVVTDNASIENADVAINVGANAKYYLTNTTFLNNKLSINAINTNLLNCTIDQCSFDNTKLPPFSNQLPASHLQYNNVTNLEIGSTLNNKPNIFKHAQTAIYVTNSDLKIFNSNFTEIGFDSYEADVVPPVLIRQGYGIAATNTTANAFNIVVDKNQLLNPNSFLNCNHAVYVKGRYNTTIANNNYDRCTTGNYCSYHDLATNNITIADNKFTQCINPIHCYNNPTSTIAITDNLINMQSATTALPYSAINYGNRAIVLREVKGTINLNVTGNKMSNISEGIYCINVKGAAQGDVTIGALNADPNIFSNEYIITTPQVNLLNRTHYGINLINCQLINLLGNRAKWSFTPTVAAQDVLRGISLMDCKSLFVVQNKTEKLGTGIRYWGDCTMGQLKCNTMTSCYQSVYLDPVGVNNKISDVGAWSGSAATSTSWKNRWVTPKHNLNYRVDGAAAQGFIINWTWDIANTIGDLKPVPHEPNLT
ncbi:MAG: SprB repeat-containing protein [Bacteroidetes bacterium]|nr:SprB repeat-containing protein [Bacteroidota bacterium]